ncbi:leukotriene-A4 hydrolase [Russula ochroleuca]|jgi:leukotriene-A4 hydrolase|uniref:Leukotriene-A4 hydrolase n=1 Tax=Russula ochroleuca TaxID=152965 RepID=A0A9P5MWY1_9AGAM|nr:leukotriene-A4 hydrolase [Russula ochroleuca]
MPDPTTQSNYLQVYTTNVDFDWTLDFEKQVLEGAATHTLLARETGIEEVIFDTSDLEISKVLVDERLVDFVLGAKHEVMGSALNIPLLPGTKAGSTAKVTIYYKTTKDSTALQWLAKEQTQGKQFAYLFSQCQPIYARALAPLQDTPSLKITYSARVASVLPVLLSAIRVSPPSEGPAHDGKSIGKDVVSYVYEQPVGIPSYLIAIASGNLHYKPFPAIEGKSWKSGVWAEPELLEACYWEFSEDTGRFLSKEEDIVGPYKFGVYDVLVLPPSFPYGGMENACLSFLTPTLLAGDRSLVDVVVHELTHSWFGNGITHAEATHFWLNEGWTTYIERLLQQFLHSPADRGFQYVVGSTALSEALDNYVDKPKYQRLVIDFEPGEDPDDAYSSIPYEKGSTFLLYLEQTLGGLDVFLPYVRDYVSSFQGKSITTWDWKAHLFTYFENHGDPEKIDALNGVDWDAWFYGEGPELPVKPSYDTTLADPAYTLAARWDTSRSISDVSELDFARSDVAAFNSNQKVVFLERLATYAPLPSAHIGHLGTLYEVAASANAEIRLRFYNVALKDPTSLAALDFTDQALKWVTGRDGTGVIKGRMKFCRPTFRAANRVNAILAKEYFVRSKEEFHPIARKLIEKDLASI